jgi:hypothetical protein
MLAEDGEATAVELADLFCGQARLRVGAHFAALWHNRDDGNYRAAQQVLDDRYTWAELGIMDPSGDGPFLAADRGEEKDAIDLRDGAGERSGERADMPGGP